MRELFGQLVGNGDHRLPDLRPRQRDHLLAGIEHLPRLGIARGDNAVEIGIESRVAKRILGLAQRGPGARQVGRGGLEVALGEVVLRLRGDAAQHQVLLARLFGLGVGELRLGVGQRRLGAAHRLRLHRGIEGGDLLALGHGRADIDEARHHAAEDAEAEIGLVARLDRADEGAERIGGVDRRHHRQNRPYRRRGLCLRVLPAGAQQGEQGQDGKTARPHRAPPAISTFWPGRRSCTPALTTTSPACRPSATTMRSLV